MANIIADSQVFIEEEESVQDCDGQDVLMKTESEFTENFRHLKSYGKTSISKCVSDISDIQSKSLLNGGHIGQHTSPGIVREHTSNKAEDDTPSLSQDQETLLDQNIETGTEAVSTLAAFAANAANFDGNMSFEGLEVVHESEVFDSTMNTEDLEIVQESEALGHEEGCNSPPSIFEPEIKIESPNEEDGDALIFNTSFSDCYADSDDPDDKEYIPVGQSTSKKKMVKDDGRERNYQCPFCEKMFLTSSAMNGHVAKYHGTTLGEKFTCHVCGALGSSRSSLKRHLIRTHKIKDVDHPELLTKECSHCNSKFVSLHLLHVHIREKHTDNLGEYYVCKWCPVLIKSKGSFSRHIRRAHKDKEVPYCDKEACSFCGLFFPNKALLQRHRKRDHPEENRNICSVCSAEFKYPYLLTRHQRSHKDKEVPDCNKEVCPFCDLFFPNKTLLQRHRKSDHPEENRNICSFCNSEFKYPYLLTRHERTHKSKEITDFDTEICTICGLLFPNKALLECHCKTDHPEGNRNVCSICNAEFKHPYSLTRHQVKHNNPEKWCEMRRRRRYLIPSELCDAKECKSDDGDDRVQRRQKRRPPPPADKTYTCRQCGLTFPTALQNRKHYRRTHHRERAKRYCYKCKCTFSTVEECNEHMKTHPISCEVCHKQFFRRDSFREHLLIHSAPRHQCPHCDKKFTQHSNLKRHIRLHTGEKPYKCSHCSRRFSDKSSCNSHEKVHTGEERSTCSVCGVSFSKKQKLKYHMRIHTGQGLLYCPLCTRPHTDSYSFRKHTQSHQLPLEKAISSLGFNSLLTADPSFVERALNELIQINLSTVSRHENIPNSFLDTFKEKNSNGECSNLNETERRIEQVVKQEPLEVESQITEGETNAEDHQLQTSNLPDPYHNVTKFLQTMFERVNVKVNSRRRDRKRKKTVDGDSSETCETFANEVESEDDELPSSVSDDFIQKCLEIIMKEEEEPSNETTEYSDVCNMYINTEVNCSDSQDLNFIDLSQAIKTEPVDMESECNLDPEFLDKQRPFVENFKKYSKSIKIEPVDAKDEYGIDPASPICLDQYLSDTTPPVDSLEPFQSIKTQPSIPKLKISRVNETNLDSNENKFRCETFH